MEDLEPDFLDPMEAEFEEAEPLEIKEAASFASSFHRILSSNLPDNQPAILYKYKTPENKIADQNHEHKLKQIKRAEKEKESKKNYSKITDVVKEKQLRKVALAGGNFYISCKAF